MVAVWTAARAVVLKGEPFRETPSVVGVQYATTVTSVPVEK